ncbi:hypothetical protein L6164_018868 [Bauhinia variegata]|uniref:Uncharacterized protein n=1 Tax=Bauhinia variegata TaxID=167791 RepID=A0ACB9NDE3_BAUVA|nr:hypothetical protein L6164_018868 [Bauhinia variegata]
MTCGCLGANAELYCKFGITGRDRDLLHKTIEESKDLIDCYNISPLTDWIARVKSFKGYKWLQIHHSLDHQNVLNFCSWYETSAHLWLVLEYCGGGDLLNLLWQVPSTSFIFCEVFI